MRILYQAKYRQWLHAGLILAAILTAAWLRFWRLSELPPGFYYDEAYNAMDGLWMFDTLDFQAHFVGNTGRHAMMPYLLAVSMNIWGVTPYAARLAAPMVGVLLVALHYRWMLTLFAHHAERRWLALVAAAGLGFSFWHVVMSRTAYEATLVPFFLALTGYLFWRGWRTQSLWYFAAAGAALGLGQYTYVSARLLPLIFGLFVLVWTVLAGLEARRLWFLGERSRRQEDGNHHRISRAGSDPTPSQPPSFDKLRTQPARGRSQNLSPSGGERGGESISQTHLSALGPARGRSQNQATPLKNLWFGLMLMALTSFLFFIPLGLFILNDPVTFFFRSDDLFIANRAARGEASAVAQLFLALRIFIDSSSETWRHNIVGQGGFNWLNIIGFFVGLGVLLLNWRQPAYLFLLIGLLITWIPAPLATGISTLRISALLPVYYTIMAVGLVSAASWLARRLQQPVMLFNLILVGLVFGVSGGGTAYNYFARWAQEPEVYRAYQGRYVDIARQVVEQSHTADVLLPFDLYVNPSVRFTLYDEFEEIRTPPATSSSRPVILIKQPKSAPSALVWLARDETGQGLAYIVHAQPPEALSALTPRGDTVELRNPYDTETTALINTFESIAPLKDEFSNWDELAAVDYIWQDQIRLFGYEVWPKQVQQGESPVLNLYWQSLIGQPHARTQFIQLVNHRGEAVAQWTDSSLYDEHRWRAGGIIPDQHVLWLSPEAAPGAYLVRTGLFDYSTNRRMPVFSAEGKPLGDQVMVGLFYVVDGETDLRSPRIPLKASLGDQIEFLGFSHPPLQAGENPLPVWLHWQAIDNIEEDYTIFVQLLDSDGQLVAGWDSEPLAGQYPTSIWQPGETVVDEFSLPLPEPLPAGDYRLIAGMYNFETGERLPAFAEDGARLADDAIVLRRFHLPVTDDR